MAGGSEAGTAFCQTAPTKETCQSGLLTRACVSHSSESQRAGGPRELETVTEISFSPALRNRATSLVCRVFQSASRRTRESTSWPLMRTTPCLKVRADSLAVVGTAGSVNERWNTAQIGIAP